MDQFKSELAVEETKVLTHFIVVKRGRCLVGYSTATERGILQVGPVPNPRAESCNTVGCPFVESLKAKFPGVFSGVGRLKNYQLKLHIDPQVTPVIQKIRRIPFSLKDKVTAKVNELLEKDVIKRAEGPTTWISPVVVAPKPSGKHSEEHDRNLIKVLERLKERGPTVSAEKCTFRMTKVVFMGILLTRHGIGPTKEKVRAVVEASQPQSPSEVRSFLGLVGFSARFIPDFSTTADPLRKIARQGESFIWGEEQEKSFQKLKGQIASAPVLAYFDKEAYTQIIADASPVGLGAVLMQEKNGERRAVCYASRTLSNVELRYSQTEREA